MGQKSSDRPTDYEMELLRLLWDRKRQTVRQLHETVLEKRRGVAYTTILNRLDIMYKKGFVLREMRHGSYVYRATHSEAVMMRRIVRSLIKNCFGGSAVNLVVYALETKKVSPEDVRHFRELLEDLERKK